MRRPSFLAFVPVHAGSYNWAQDPIMKVLEYDGYVKKVPVTAALLLACSMFSAILCVPTLVQSFRKSHLPSICLCIWALYYAFENIVNVYLWPYDNLPQWYWGQGYCDVAIKLDVAGTLGLLGCLVTILRSLGLALQTNRVHFTQAQKKRQIAIDCLYCFGLPLYIGVAHYIVQYNRYYIFAISGCYPSYDTSWLSILLMYVPPAVLVAVASAYAVLVVVRVFRYRRAFEEILSNSTSGLSKGRFTRLYALSLSLLLIYLPIQVFQLVENLQYTPTAYSFAADHSASNWDYLIFVPAFGEIWWDRWIRTSLGFATFCTLGAGATPVQTTRNVFIFFSEHPPSHIFIIMTRFNNNHRRSVLLRSSNASGMTRLDGGSSVDNDDGGSGTPLRQMSLVGRLSSSSASLVSKTSRFFRDFAAKALSGFDLLADPRKPGSYDTNFGPDGMPATRQRRGGGRLGRAQSVYVANTTTTTGDTPGCQASVVHRPHSSYHPSMTPTLTGSLFDTINTDTSHPLAVAASSSGSRNDNDTALVPQDHVYAPRSLYLDGVYGAATTTSNSGNGNGNGQAVGEYLGISTTTAAEFGASLGRVPLPASTADGGTSSGSRGTSSISSMSLDSDHTVMHTPVERVEDNGVGGVVMMTGGTGVPGGVLPGDVTLVNTPVDGTAMDVPGGSTLVNTPVEDTVMHVPGDNTIMNTSAGNAIMHAPVGNTIMNTSVGNNTGNTSVDNNTIMNTTVGNTIGNTSVGNTFMNTPVGNNTGNTPVGNNTMMNAQANGSIMHTSVDNNTLTNTPVDNTIMNTSVDNNTIMNTSVAATTGLYTTTDNNNNNTDNTAAAHDNAAAIFTNTAAFNANNNNAATFPNAALNAANAANDDPGQELGTLSTLSALATAASVTASPVMAPAHAQHQHNINEQGRAAVPRARLPRSAAAAAAATAAATSSANAGPAGRFQIRRKPTPQDLA